MERRQVLATLMSVPITGCSALGSSCPSVEFEAEEICPSHELAIDLRVEPSTVTLPGELKFTIRNQTKYRFVFSPDEFPLVYERSGFEWTQVPIERRIDLGETVTVSESYTFTQQYPFFDWKPEPGRYLLLFAGHLETTDGERVKRVNLVNSVEFRGE